MFIQIHTLTSYPASLLNRDDAGLAKRVPFGNAVRLRVSSQCLKRHWRDRLTTDLPNKADGVRSRHFFSRIVVPGIIAAGVEPERAEALCVPLVEALIDGGTNGLEMKQPVLFGAREAEYLIRLAAEAGAAAATTKDGVESLKKVLADKEQKKNLKAMSKSAAGLTAALFGRFVTSDILSRVDAPVHVAHAVTVHASQTELDYFTVVDDLNREEESGAAHANETELGAGIFYGYVVIDLPLLVSNLSGCEPAQWRNQDPVDARRVIKAIVRAVAEQSPGAKLGSTAPYSRAECMLLESGTAQPRSLVNAYLQAIRPSGDAMQEAMNCMGDYLSAIDAMYGTTAHARALSTIKDPASFGSLRPVPVDASIDAVLDAAWHNA